MRVSGRSIHSIQNRGDNGKRDGIQLTWSEIDMRKSVFVYSFSAQLLVKCANCDQGAITSGEGTDVVGLAHPYLSLFIVLVFCVVFTYRFGTPARVRPV